MTITTNISENNGYFFDLADELARRAERLRPLWHMTRAERLAAFHRGEMSEEEMFAWAARFPREVPTLNGEFIFIAASTPEACVPCPVCGDDEVMLAAGGTLGRHPDHRHAYDPNNPTTIRPVCPASHVKPADAVGMSANVPPAVATKEQEHALAA
jgi:hypothetical protein